MVFFVAQHSRKESLGTSYKLVMSGCFLDGIFGTLLLEQEYAVIEVMACEAN
jgi:hypothetical protein